MLFSYIRKYIPLFIIAALCMTLEVFMDLLQPNLIRIIVDEGVLMGDVQLIIRIGIIMLLVTFIGALGGSTNNVFVHISSQSVGNNIRKDAFSKIMTFSFPQMDRMGTGSLVTRVTNDITQIQNFLSVFVRSIIRNGFMVVGAIFFMYRLYPGFGLTVLMALPVMFLIMVICLSRANPYFDRLQKSLDQVNSILQEDITGLRIIKACVKEIYEKLRFNKANDELIRNQLKIIVIFAFLNPVLNSIIYLITAAILVMGSYQVRDGVLMPGAVMAALTYTMRLLHGVLMVVMIFQNISRGLVSWKRLKEVLTTEPEIVDGERCDGDGSHGELEFRNVSFSYPTSDRPTLEGIDLTVHRGETLGILGSTGSGKTTLINLIPRFYDVTSGEILIDGVNIKEYRLESLRSKVSLALQKSELFTLSIRDNISWGDRSASAEEIVESARIAQADQFIEKLEDGYETQVEERGMSLSGGQKQRIALARATLKKSEFLILDDATSALDLKTEADFFSSLSKARPEVTKIIVAQRIASVLHADRIIVLENGHIAASGKHRELIESSPIYQDIYYSQQGKEGLV